jgi:hypothetical protein
MLEAPGWLKRFHLANPIYFSSVVRRQPCDRVGGASFSPFRHLWKVDKFKVKSGKL